MGVSAADKRLHERKAEILAAAGHPIRLGIIEFLSGGQQCVCDIAAHLAAKQSNVSRHLAVLLKAGIVEHRKEGLRVIYSLKAPCILAFLSCVTELLREQLQDERRLLKKL
jgi:ArsR family transcriptional regulator